MGNAVVCSTVENWVRIIEASGNVVRRKNGICSGLYETIRAHESDVHPGNAENTC